MIEKLITPNNTHIEKIDFPIDEVEAIIEQIIKVNKETKDCMYSHHIDETLSILNEMLRLLTKPILVVNTND
jgi:hypothetical protein